MNENFNSVNSFHSLQFYLKADNEVIAKVNAIHKIKNRMVNGHGFKVKEVDLPDELVEQYFGDKK